MESFLLVSFLILTCFHLKLSARLKKCEELLKQLQKPKEPVAIPVAATVAVPVEKPLPIVPPPPAAIVVKTQPAPQPTPKPKKPLPTFEIPNLIKENWMGVFGSIVLVIGAVFFGLTSEIMQRPEARVTILIVVSCLLFGISFKLNSNPQWILLTGWLKAVAGAVILFATMGAGGIAGLQFINSPYYALAFLCGGIAVNLLLSATTPFQSVASLHVILCLTAFCFAPQTFILLPLGTLVAMIGIANAHRAKWDVHLLLIVMAFSFQNFYWSHTLTHTLLPWMHYVAVSCALVVGLGAGLVHYSKKYQSPHFEVLPFFAHIANWGLLAFNVWLHAPRLHWTPVVLGCVAIAGFFLSREAKKRGIRWLYHTDAILSQLVALVAIASLSDFSVSRLDIGLLLFMETALFTWIAQFEKEVFLVRVSYFFQWCAAFTLLLLSYQALDTTSTEKLLGVYGRMGLAIALCWGNYLYNLIKKQEIDDSRYVFQGFLALEKPFSILSFLGTLFLLGIYYRGFDSGLIQLLMLGGMVAMALWKEKSEDLSTYLSLVVSLICVHILNWNQLLLLCFQKAPFPPAQISFSFLGLVALDLFLISRNSLKNYSHLLVYAIGIQVALLTFAYTQEISLLIPGPAYLIFSILALEISRGLKNQLKDSVLHVGLAYIALFLCRFVLVHLQIDPIWHGISTRWVLEILGFFSLIYWIAFSPVKSIVKGLIEVSLGFITLCFVVEMPELSRPLLWATLALALLFGSLRYHWPERLYGYSWVYFVASLIHMAFVTATLTMPSLFLWERYHLLTFLAIALQFFYAFVVHEKLKGILEAIAPSELLSQLYKQYSLTILLPVFLAVALLFAFNFEKAILTLLWVGLICVYLAVGLLIKSKRTIQISMVALALCSGRLIIFDLTQSDLPIRALVFIGVGCLMLAFSALYKKYKHRIALHEKV